MLEGLVFLLLGKRLTSPRSFYEEDYIMLKALQISANAITTFSKWLWVAGKGFAFLLMCLVFVDVFFRRLAITFVGSKDLMQIAFMILFFFSVSYAWIRGDHINVDILVEKLSPKLRKMSYFLASLIGVFLFGCLSYSSYKLLGDSIQFHSVTTDLKFPHWPMNLVMLLGSGLLTLQCIVSVMFTLGIIKKPDLYR